MEFTVHRDGAAVGTVTVTETEHAIRFEVVCKLDTTDILRCYGLRPPEAPLLVGIPEPIEGTLRLQRSLSRQSIAGALPVSYVLLDATQKVPPSAAVPEPAPLPKTGDSLLDALLLEHRIHARQQGPVLRLSCPFSAQAAFPLAFAATACRIEESEGECRAFLEIKPPTDKIL